MTLIAAYYVGIINDSLSFKFYRRMKLFSSSLGDTKGERAMASCTGEKGDRAAVVSETPHTSKDKMPKSLDGQYFYYIGAGIMLRRFFDDILFSRTNSNGTYRYEKIAETL